MLDIAGWAADLPEDLRSPFSHDWPALAARLTPEQMDPAAVPRSLPQVFACSEFVARSCVRSPEIFTSLVEAGDLERLYSPSHYRSQLQDVVAECNDEETFMATLRRFRRREMVRVAWRDLARSADLSETLEDLSSLADACIGVSLEWLYEREASRFGIPRDQEGEAQRLVVLGMGKLGGRELNFSSDIDLMFVYPRKGSTDGAAGRLNEEFFRRLGQRLIRVLGEPTSEGCVFRVDMRLRPFGSAGPLAISFDAFETYYQTHGRDWERYALIKARPVAGDIEAGERLISALRPFVYRRYLDYGAIESLREMKTMIAREVERKGLQHNVKLGPGGIREIEFIAQVFQLIYGGRRRDLRQRSLFPVLDELAAAGDLKPETVSGLRDAYRFLRMVENRLQQWSDQQTHELPQSETAKLRLAYAMGFGNWDDFVNVLSGHTRFVQQRFIDIFEPSERPVQDRQGVDFQALWGQVTETAEGCQILSAAGFQDPPRMLELLAALHSSFAYRALSKRGKERLDRLMPRLLEAVGGVAEADLALTRVLRLVEAIARRSVYLALLVENPPALAQLVRLCAASPWIAEFLGKHPLLLDELLYPASLYKPRNSEELAAEAEDFVGRASDGDLEEQMDVLRQFLQTNMLRVAAADVSEAMPLMKVSDQLTWLAEAVLGQVLKIAWNDLVSRYGEPRCVVDEKPLTAGFAIAAYGKLGGIELGYGSDLDVVFLHDSCGHKQFTSGPREVDNPTFFTRLVQRIIHILSTHTAAGVLYDVDTRLRPSGRSGMLVTSADAFANYQRTQAWTWEHQALVRARVVAGSAEIARRFAQIRHDTLCQPRQLDALRAEVCQMRERMREELGSKEAGVFDLKQDSGGIADIEFMVQYEVLAGAHQHPELLRWTDNIRQLDSLEEAGILSSEDADSLRDAYRALRRQVHLLRLQDREARLPENGMNRKLGKHRDHVQRMWRIIMEPG